MSDVATWTDERVELLKKLWNDGLSASQIAAEIGSITRNAVIGKVHRLGLSGRARPQSVAQPRPRKAPAARPTGASPPNHGLHTRGATALASLPQIMAEAAPQAAPQANPDVVVPFSERVTIMELKESMCRWPLGDPTTAEFRYCGSKSEVGTPYCQYHCRIAYQPSIDRNRRRAG
jgi:GcrA cell cycle regulator